MEKDEVPVTWNRGAWADKCPEVQTETIDTGSGIEPLDQSEWKSNAKARFFTASRQLFTLFASTLGKRLTVSRTRVDTSDLAIKVA